MTKPSNATGELILNEDDTFRRLKRIPYEEMRRQIVQISVQQFVEGPGSRKRKIDALEAGGWTLEEYRDERVKDAQRRSGQKDPMVLAGFSSI